MKNKVQLIGHYGSDLTHAQSAWTSTSRDLTDEKRGRVGKLLKMLAENGHHTPFEKSSLHFLVTCDQASHIHLLKHRIGVSCLSGDTIIQFLNTNGDTTPKLKYTIEELYKKWNKGRHHQNTYKDKLYARRRIRQMNIETLDPKSLKIIKSNIQDVYYNGIKDVYKYYIEEDKFIACTKDHKVFTENGEWVSIDVCYNNSIKIAYKTHTNNPYSIKPYVPNIDYIDEIWKPISKGYEVSNLGRVRSYYNNRYLTNTPKIKKLTNSKGYNVVNINNVTKKVSRLVLETFKPIPESKKLQCRHLNNNSLDDRLLNLDWGTDKQNKEDWDIHPQKMVKFYKLFKREYVGPKPVYDLTVKGTHNYTANNFIVHNCNGESARYKELKEDKYYIPGDWDETLQQDLIDFTNQANEYYHNMIEILTPKVGRKRAKESARFFKTMNSQITMDVMFNWRSFYHFLNLRMKPDAQREIREIAEEMLNLVKGIEGNPFKETLEAFGLETNDDE